VLYIYEKLRKLSRKLLWSTISRDYLRWCNDRSKSGRRFYFATYTWHSAPTICPFFSIAGVFREVRKLSRKLLWSTNFRDFLRWCNDRSNVCPSFLVRDLYLAQRTDYLPVFFDCRGLPRGEKISVVHRREAEKIV
jgi:hypothetical protein